MRSHARHARCGLTFFPACPLEDDAMRAALERMRGGGGEFYRRVFIEYWARVQLEAKDGKMDCRRAVPVPVAKGFCQILEFVGY